MREARTLPSLEGSRKLRISLFSGVHTCLEEGALYEEGTHLVGMI
jgi:hypothetical protein